MYTTRFTRNGISPDSCPIKPAHHLQVIAISVGDDNALDSTVTGPLGMCGDPPRQLPQASTITNATGGAFYSGITPATIVETIVQSLNTTVFCLD